MADWILTVEDSRNICGDSSRQSVVVLLEQRRGDCTIGVICCAFGANGLPEEWVYAFFVGGGRDSRLKLYYSC